MTFISSDGIIRPITEQDVDAVTRLHRHIHHIPPDLPISEEERGKVRVYSVTFCLEIDGKLVAVASSNG